MKFVDIHTHKLRDTEAIQVVDLSEESSLLSEMHVYYSLGVHPWFIEAKNLDVEWQKIASHLKMNSFLAIGECGLDKVCATDFSLQVQVFEKQIALSEKYQKPLILHVVKAFNILIQIRLKSKAIQPWVVHGFNGSPQLAKQLVNLGMYISFGFQLEKSVSKASKSIGAIPISSIFLETDDSEFSIEDLYAFASEKLNIDVVRLKSQLYLNFMKIFSKI